MQATMTMQTIQTKNGLALKVAFGLAICVIIGILVYCAFVKGNV